MDLNKFPIVIHPVREANNVCQTIYLLWKRMYLKNIEYFVNMISYQLTLDIRRFEYKEMKL